MNFEKCAYSGAFIEASKEERFNRPGRVICRPSRVKERKMEFLATYAIQLLVAFTILVFVATAAVIFYRRVSWSEISGVLRRVRIIYRWRTRRVRRSLRQARGATMNRLQELLRRFFRLLFGGGEGENATSNIIRRMYNNRPWRNHVWRYRFRQWLSSFTNGYHIEILTVGFFTGLLILGIDVSKWISGSEWPSYFLIASYALTLLFWISTKPFQVRPQHGATVEFAGFYVGEIGPGPHWLPSWLFTVTPILYKGATTVKIYLESAPNAQDTIELDGTHQFTARGSVVEFRRDSATVRARMFFETMSVTAANYAADPLVPSLVETVDEQLRAVLGSIFINDALQARGAIGRMVMASLILPEVELPQDISEEERQRIANIKEALAGKPYVQNPDHGDRGTDAIESRFLAAQLIAFKDDEDLNPATLPWRCFKIARWGVRFAKDTDGVVVPDIQLHPETEEARRRVSIAAHGVEQRALDGEAAGRELEELAARSGLSTHESAQLGVAQTTAERVGDKTIILGGGGRSSMFERFATMFGATFEAGRSATSREGRERRGLGGLFRRGESESPEETEE